MTRIFSLFVPFWLALALSVSASAIPTRSSCLGPMVKVSGQVLAAELGLHYISPLEAAKGPGISRIAVQVEDPVTHKKQTTLTYFDAQGAPLFDEQKIQEITQDVRIPPGYTAVWISEDPLTHVRGVGTDSKGSVQYFYHSLWEEARAREKFQRMISFGMAQTKLSEQVEHDLSLSGFPKEKVTALVVNLLDKSLIRVGTEEYLKKNGTSGLTTMLKEDVSVEGDTTIFDFTGKSMAKNGQKKKKKIEVKDQRIVDLVSALLNEPGDKLFQYQTVSADGSLVWHEESSHDVNSYIKATTGGAFSAKDYRTWKATVYAAAFLKNAGPFQTEDEAMKNIVLASAYAADHLHNTWRVCKEKYIDPAIFDAYLKQKPFFEAFTATGGNTEDAVVLLSSQKVIPR